MLQMKKMGLCLLMACFAFISIHSQTKSTKKGIAYGHHTVKNMEVISKGVSWWYNWSPTPEIAAADEIEFIPMAWNGVNETAMRTFYTAHPEVKYILGFNEPNFTSQANMTPAVAASKWPAIEKIADEFGLKIVGPAVNYCGGCVDIPGTTADSDPVVYLDSFFSACHNCRVDYIAVHNYMCYSGALSSYIDRFKKYGKKIWLTEFACWDGSATYSAAYQKSYLMGAIDLLENDTMVYKYSWFNSSTSGSPYINIFDPKTGELSDLGKFYVNFMPVHDTNTYTNIPSRIEAENYVKMNGVNLEGTSDVDGEANVGYIDAGDWLQYQINAPEEKDYYVYVRLAVNVSNTSVQLKENGNIITTIAAASTGGWQNWKTFSQKIHLTAGHHIIQVFAPTGGFNINWITFTLPTEVSTIDENNKVYPNPANDKLFIKLDRNLMGSMINVVDPSGRVVLNKLVTENQNSTELDVRSLVKGNYFVQILGDDIARNYQIIKQ